jgi:dihydrofolate reductase
MGKLVEAVHVTLGGEVGTTNWAHPYLDEQFGRYAMELLAGADALLLGRVTYEGLSAAYTRMAEESGAGAPTQFIDRMNAIPKFVASSTLRELSWNASVIDGDVASFVDELKREAGRNLLKYGNGPLDATLVEHGLIDEFHLFLTPVAIGTGTHLFESIGSGPHLHLRLVQVTRFDSGVLALVYAPK